MCFSVSDNHNKEVYFQISQVKDEWNNKVGNFVDWTTGLWTAELVNLLGYLSPKEVEGTMATLKILAII